MIDVRCVRVIRYSNGCPIDLPVSLPLLLCCNYCLVRVRRWIWWRGRGRWSKSECFWKQLRYCQHVRHPKIRTIKNSKTCSKIFSRHRYALRFAAWQNDRLQGRSLSLSRSIPSTSRMDSTARLRCSWGIGIIPRRVLYHHHHCHHHCHPHRRRRRRRRRRLDHLHWSLYLLRFVP